MKNLKRAIYAIVFTIVFSFTFQCASSKEVAKTFEYQPPFILNSVVFQEWYAGIKVGGTGINLFLPISDVKGNIVFDEVYFRNLKAKLVKKEHNYTATLKNPSRQYSFKIAEKPGDYPFDLKDDECVLTYIQNGETKFYKILALKEVAGTYYENGAPSIYTRNTSAGMASLDEDEEDN